MYATQVVIFIINTVFLVVVTCIRFGHPGKVCAGDYLFTPVSDQQPKNGILGVEGQFLTVFIAAGWV